MQKILVIDPSLSEGESKGFFWLKSLLDAWNFPAITLDFIAPCWQQKRLQAHVRPEELAGIIMLGSKGNVTDEHVWMDELAEDIKPFLFEHSVPFFGICFAHQFLARACGAQVGYVRERREIPYFRCIRRTSLLHPKLAMLNACFSLEDYGSENKRDQEFRFAFQYSRNFKQRDWVRFESEEWPIVSCVSVQEERFRRWLASEVAWSFAARVAHEQEVYGLEGSSLVWAGTSLQCEYDALVHPELPIFTVQPHPETAIAGHEGWQILRNFMYFCYLRGAGEI